MDRNDEIFRKRSGTTDRGKDYEDLNIANYVLALVTDENIKNFWISSNNKCYGAFDDIVIQTESELSEEKYALQLKYSNKNKSLVIDRLTREDGDFSLKKYFRSFQNIKNSPASDHTCILFTNYKFNFKSGQQIQLVNEPFKIKLEKCIPLTLLNTSAEYGQCYKFHLVNEENYAGRETEEYKHFFDRFYLYTNQANCEKLENIVKKKMQRMFCCCETDFNRYLQFIRNWSIREGTKPKLSKEFMRDVIALCLLSSFIKPISSGSVSNKMKILRRAILAFDITVFNKSAYDHLKEIWFHEDRLENVSEKRYVRNKYQLHVDLNNSNQSRENDEYMKLLWLMNTGPLFVEESETTYKAIHLCPHRKYVIFGNGLSEDQFRNYSVFYTLSDLRTKNEMYNIMLDMCEVLIQGRNKTCLRLLLQNDELLEQTVTVNHLLKMLIQIYKIEDETEQITTPYVSRMFSRNIISNAYLETIGTDTLVIINCKNKIKNFESEFPNFNVIEADKYLKTTENITETPFSDIFKTEYFKNVYDLQFVRNSEKLKTIRGPKLFITSKKYSQEDFKTICNKNPHKNRYHYFVLTENHNLEWIRSQGDISDLKQYQITEQSIEEKVLLTETPENNINIIVGDPGIGKSELMKIIKNNYLPQFWTVILRPKDISSLCTYLCDKTFQEHDLVDFILESKYNNFDEFDKNVLKRLMETNKISYIWDAVDEITFEDLKTVFCILSILSQKTLHWITCRPHLKDYVEKKLGVLSRIIYPFDVSQQTFYLENRLANVFPRKYLADIIKKLENKFTLINHSGLLENPLQLFMLTELFIQDPEKYFIMLSKDLFSLTDLYRYIVDEKFITYYREKADIHLANLILTKILEDHKKMMIEKYEKAALITVEAETTLMICQEILEEIRHKHDTIGLIIDVVDGFPHFIHNSYAEYFAAKYLSSHYRNINDFETIIFDEKNSNIRFFFDMLLAQKSPVHFAVLHKNVSLLRTYDEKLDIYRDMGGRNPLHLACSWGQRYPLLNVEISNDVCVVDNENDTLLTPENAEYVNLINYLVEKCNPFEIDDVFMMSALSYAQKTNCIYAIIKIHHQQKKKFSKLKATSYNILYYSVKFGYEEVIDLFEDFSLVKTKKNGFSLLHLAVIHSQIECLKKLLIQRIYKKSIDDVDEYNGTALHRACHGGHKLIVQLLIEYGANIDTVTTNGWTSLYIACYKGHNEIVEILVKSGANIHASENFGWTPLHVSCQKGHNEIVSILIANGADVNCTDAECWTPLHLACWKGHYDTVELLIQEGADINFAKEGGWTPLHVACENGHDRIVALLIRFGVNINASTDKEWTPLHVACANGHERCIYLLIKSGTDVNIVTNTDASPLHVACANRHENVINSLMSLGANINVSAHDGWTPVHIACWRRYYDIVKLLIDEYGANVNTIKNDGVTSLHIACHNGDYPTTSLLIRFNAKVNVKENRGWTPLHIACYNGYYDITELLITSEAKINTLNNNRSTPLHLACQKGHLKVVQLLIANDAVKEAVNLDGARPLHLACRNGHKEIVGLLISHGAVKEAFNQNGDTPLHMACQNNHHEIVQILIDAKTDINVVNSAGCTSLYLACEKGNLETVELLYKFEASMSADGDCTPLHIACYHGHIKIVELLLRNSVNVLICEKSSVTPLHMACIKGNTQVAKLLIASGFNTNATNMSSRTALHFACVHGHINTVQLLLESEVSIDVQDINGWTALHFACRENHGDIVKMLVKSGASVDVVTRDGKTPLDVASCEKNRAIVHWLKERDVRFVGMYKENRNCVFM